MYIYMYICVYVYIYIYIPAHADEAAAPFASSGDWNLSCDVMLLGCFPIGWLFLLHALIRIRSPDEKNDWQQSHHMIDSTVRFSPPRPDSGVAAGGDAEMPSDAGRGCNVHVAGSMCRVTCLFPLVARVYILLAISLSLSLSLSWFLTGCLSVWLANAEQEKSMPADAPWNQPKTPPQQAPLSKGGLIRLETLIELKFVTSSFSSLSSYWNWTNTSLSSDSRQQHLSRQYPHPPPLTLIPCAQENILNK